MPGAAAGIAAEVVVTVDRHREQELAQPWPSSARWRGKRRGRRCVTGGNAMRLLRGDEKEEPANYTTFRLADRGGVAVPGRPA
uniref:Uncharacterized protein n=1 Tax=Oryza glumipatula TaxID=40148 RepID=A0A0D9YFP3_9ORYZ